MTDEAINSLIEENILLASENHKAALEKLFEGFLNGPLYVINRAQSHTLAHEPQYPSDLISFLGVQDKDRVVVPVFSQPAFVEEWTGKPLFHRILSGKQILDMIPEEWWICINPGQEIEKDLSPWEQQCLKHGEPGMKEIFQELNESTSVVEMIDLRQPEEKEFDFLRQKLTDFVQDIQVVEKLYMLIEKSLTTDGDTIEKILVGVECNPKYVAEVESAKEKIQQLCDINLVGNLESKILAGLRGNNILLGAFKDTQPFYTQKKSLTKGILALLKRR